MERMSVVFHLMARRSRSRSCCTLITWSWERMTISCLRSLLFLPLAHQWHWLHHLLRIAGQWQLSHWRCHEITWCWSAVWCCNSATNLWTIKIKSLHMLWSQYKLTTIIHTEFLRKHITGIPNFAYRNSNFLTLQTSEFQKKIRPESSESKTESEFRLRWESQKSEPKIRRVMGSVSSHNVRSVAPCYGELLALLVICSEVLWYVHYDYSHSPSHVCM